MDRQTLINDTEFEEGEVLEDDAEDLYTPLERPHIPLVSNRQLGTSESEDDNTFKESSSDSDSSAKNSSKIQRKTLPKQARFTIEKKKKNYNIWGSDLQTDILTNSLLDCNVDQSNERIRNVESYNYKLAQFDRKISNEDERKREKHSFKRKHNGVQKNNISQHKQVNELPLINKNNAGSTRNILNLHTTVENSESEIATDIANKLLEKKEDLILRAINVLGKEAVISLFEETKDIEASGGMLIMNGTRRRTPGGVFFFLLKTSESLSRDKINEIFLEDKKSMAKSKKKTANEIKKARAAKFKEALRKDDFPTLLSRTELVIKEFKAKRLAEGTTEVANPPPSPATDGRDFSSDGEDLKGTGNVQHERKFSSRNEIDAYDDIFDCDEDNMN